MEQTCFQSRYNVGGKYLTVSSFLFQIRLQLYNNYELNFHEIPHHTFIRSDQIDHLPPKTSFVSSYFSQLLFCTRLGQSFKKL